MILRQKSTKNKIKSVPTGLLESSVLSGRDRAVLGEELPPMLCLPHGHHRTGSHRTRAAVSNLSSPFIQLSVSRTTLETTSSTKVHEEIL